MLRAQGAVQARPGGGEISREAAVRSTAPLPSDSSVGHAFGAPFPKVVLCPHPHAGLLV